MIELASVVLPVFGLLALGYGAGWLKLVGDKTGDGLSEYVFVIATPALVFKTLLAAKLPDVQPWGYWLAYFGGAAVVWALAMLASTLIFRTAYRESVVAGFAAGQSNTVLVGIPVILKAYGEAGSVPLFLLIAVHLPVTMTAATMLIEGAGGLDLRKLAMRLVTHPILLGLFAGAAMQFSGLHLPGPVTTMLDMLAASAIPCALVAMGLALRRYGMREKFAPVALVAFLKLMAHPAAVYVLAFWVLPVPPVWAGVAVLFAAMPSGINSYLFAEYYRTGQALSSSAIALTTGLAVLTTLFWLSVLGVIPP